MMKYDYVNYIGDYYLCYRVLRSCWARGWWCSNARRVLIILQLAGFSMEWLWCVCS